MDDYKGSLWQERKFLNNPGVDSLCGWLEGGGCSVVVPVIEGLRNTLLQPIQKRHHTHNQNSTHQRQTQRRLAHHG